MIARLMRKLILTSLVVVALITNPAGGIDNFAVQSELSRVVELTADFKP